MVKYYRKAHELRNKQKNQELWLQGMYIYEALCDTAPLFRALGGKGAKAAPYAKEPYPLTDSDVSDREQRDEQIKYDKMKAKMDAWMKVVNSNK